MRVKELSSSAKFYSHAGKQKGRHDTQVFILASIVGRVDSDLLSAFGLLQGSLSHPYHQDHLAQPWLSSAGSLPLAWELKIGSSHWSISGT